MDLPPDKSKVLWGYNKDRKWELIRDQRKVHAKQQPNYYLAKLSSYMDPRASRLSKKKREAEGTKTSTQILRDLEISLRTNSIDWVREFLLEKKNNGLNILIDYLTFRLLMLQRDLVDKKLSLVAKTNQASTSIAINQDVNDIPKSNGLFSDQPPCVSANQNGTKQPNSLLNSLLASHANGHLDTMRTQKQSHANLIHGISPKSTLSSSSSSSNTTNSTYSSKSNPQVSSGYNSTGEFKQRRSWASLIHSTINSSLSHPNDKLCQEMSSRLDEATNQLTGNNLIQLSNSSQQLHSTLQVFPKNHSQKLNLGSIEDDIHVCVMCLKSIMNNKQGFNMVMEHPQAINCLALSLNQPALRTKTLVFNILSAVCLVKGNHEMIISAFNNFKLVCHEKLRFETLIYYLKDQEKFDIDFMVSCLQFINILVHSVDDMNYRTHLQYEFTNLGLDDYLDKLKQSESEELRVQIQTYLDNRIDVSALAEESEAKNNAMEQVQQLLEKLSIANEVQANFQLNYQALDYRLQEANQKNEELAKANRDYQQQLERTKKQAELYRTSMNRMSKDLDSVKVVQGEIGSSGQRLADAKLNLKVTTNNNEPVSIPHINGSAPSSPPQQQQQQQQHQQPPPPPPPPPPLSSSNILIPKTRADAVAPGSVVAPPPPPPPPPPPSSKNPVQNNLSVIHGPSKTKPMAPKPPNNLVRNDLPSDVNCDMMTLKKTFSTQYKLPTFNWLTLKPNQVRGTVFNEFHDEEKIIKSINFEEFEAMFKLGDKNTRSPTKNSNGQGNAVSASSNAEGSDSSFKRMKQPEKVSLLEHNRLRNMAISLRKLSLPIEIVVNCVNRLDINRISSDNIEILMRMIPTADEMKQYREYESKGKPFDALTDEDNFLNQFGKVERLEQKLKVMHYMKNLEPTTGSNSVNSYQSISSSNTDSSDLLATTKARIESIESASKSLKSSEGIRTVLEYILVFGNYLNSSSRSLASAPAYGFKLQALDMVTEARSTQDKSRNLLHFIVDTILKNLTPKEKAKLSPMNSSDQDPSNKTKFGAKKVLPFGANDLENIRMPYEFDSLLTELEQASCISLETLISEVKEFERGLELCIKELDVRYLAVEALEKSSQEISDAPTQIKPPPDDAIRRLQAFIKSRSCDVLEIKEAIQRAQREFNECAQFFGESPRTIESSSLFSTFLRHLKNFKQCQIQNRLMDKRKFDEELRRQVLQQQALRARNRKMNDSEARGIEKSTLSVPDGIEVNDNRVLPQNEVSHGTLDVSYIILTIRLPN